MHRAHAQRADRPSRHAVMMKPIGERHFDRHIFFSGVSW